jgi:hypothetical protein
MLLFNILVLSVETLLVIFDEFFLEILDGVLDLDVDLSSGLNEHWSKPFNDNCFLIYSNFLSRFFKNSSVLFMILVEGFLFNNIC